MAIIKHTTGNVFDSECIPIVTTNCFGAMGAGVALECKKRYPATYEYYRQKCKEGYYKPGQPVLTSVDHTLLLFPTKDDWRKPSQYQWIKEDLDRIVKNADHFDDLAIPPLGCGNGGLN